MPGRRRDRLRSNPPTTCAAASREPWASPGAAAPPLPSPRFRPRPGGGRDRGRAAPSACAWELPPPARAPARRAHRPRQGVAPGPKGLGHASKTPSELDTGRGRPVPRRSRSGWATRHLRPLGNPDLAGPWPASAAAASWEGEPSQRRLLPLPESQRQRRARPPSADRRDPRRGPTTPQTSCSHQQVGGASTSAVSW